MIWITIGALPFVFYVLYLLSYQLDKNDWNNGVCPCGKGWWKSFDTDSSGATGYKCTECCQTVWIGHEKVTRS